MDDDAGANPMDCTQQVNGHAEEDQQHTQTLDLHFSYTPSQQAANDGGAEGPQGPGEAPSVLGDATNAVNNNATTNAATNNNTTPPPVETAPRRVDLKSLNRLNRAKHRRQKRLKTDERYGVDGPWTPCCLN